jgi:diguanylate cyclase (GGDEF)-like protein/PAS domain S-box-containing protein
MMATLDRPLRVQIVEDERIVAFDLRSGLEQLGHEVVGIASSEQEALRLALRETPDLVLMDIHLDHGSDGVAAACELREQLAIPVIFLTAYGETETLRRAAQAAPYGYLLKPFELRELNATLHMAMARRSEERKTEAAERRLLLALESAQLAVLESHAGELRWGGHQLGQEFRALTQAASMVELQQHLEPPAQRALQALLEHGIALDLTCRWLAPGGAARWLEIHARRFEHEQLVMGMVRDVTARVEGETRLRQAVAAFDATDEAIMFLDAQHRVLSCNPAFTALTGWSESQVLGRRPSEFLYARRHGDHPDFKDEAPRHGEVSCMRRDGSTFPALEHLSAVLDEQGLPGHHVLSFSDISEIRNTQRKLQHLALHDTLTGLGNRVAMQDVLDAPGLRSLGLLFIDLDGFKFINDSLGHDCGDELLKVLAVRLISILRSDDVAVRLGGDEFVVLMRHPRSTHDALQLAEKLLQALAQPVPLAVQTVAVTASIGVALFPEQVDSPQSLLRAADAAMYEAKARGRNRVALYAQAHADGASEQLRIEQGLRLALQAGQLSLHWQPMLEMDSGRILGAEALLRWQHPQLGQVSPQRFIPVAEANGMICAIGAWVMEQACAQAAAWRAQGLGLVRVAVNVSVRQFEQDDVLGLVRHCLQRHALPPQCLELELTESLFAQSATLRGSLQALRDLGVRLALDDFGTGFSSLGQIVSLPIDRIKIDRSFVIELVDSHHSRAVVKSIIMLAQTLGMEITVEGVETLAQRDVLLALGAVEAQGWLYHRAMPAEELLRLLRAH